MKRYAPVLAFLFLLLTGCGGGGSSPSPYRGAWEGMVETRDAAGQSLGFGFIAVAVDERGRVTGEWADNGGSGALSGSVSREGVLRLVTHYAEGDTITEQGSTSLNGTGWQGTLAAQDPELAGHTMQFAVERR